MSKIGKNYSEKNHDNDKAEPKYKMIKTFIQDSSMRCTILFLIKMKYIDDVHEETGSLYQEVKIFNF